MAPSTPLSAVPEVDVSRYAGRWYQVALYPNPFQKQCVSDTTATYRPLPDGHVAVINRCTTGGGAQDQAAGLARPEGRPSASTLAPAQLEVTLLPSWLRWLMRWLMRGPSAVWVRYRVIQLASDDRYAVVSEPQRDSLWMLSREPQLSPNARPPQAGHAPWGQQRSDWGAQAGGRCNHPCSLAGTGLRPCTPSAASANSHCPGPAGWQIEVNPQTTS
jgi:apolipoprotein D and lipocalin family protein